MLFVEVRLNLNAEQFSQQAAEAGIDPILWEPIARHAPEDDEYVNLYTLSQILKSFSNPPFNLETPGESGFVVVGSCSNGDQIVLKTTDDLGAVHYLNHESMHSQPYKLAKVAINLDDFMKLANDGEDPIDYYEALDLNIK